MTKGRPSAYREEYAAQAKKLAEIGATDAEIADFFDVDVRTLYRWKNSFDGFCQALKVGKDVADDRVERSLYQRAIGYEQDEVKIFMPAGAAEPVYAPFVAKVAPDTTAAIFWLKNRRREEWRDRVAIGGDADAPPIKTEEVGAGLRQLSALVASIAERQSAVTDRDAGDAPAE